MALPENLEKFIEPIIAMCSSQFPHKCGNCGKEFNDFRHFVELTRPVGAPQSSPQTDDPFGLISYVNCECGSTVLLQCADAEAHDQFKAVLEEEAKRSGRDPKEFLLELRSEVRRRVLSGK